MDRPVPHAWFFVPGNSPEKIKKSWQFETGALIFDLEDAVPEFQKLQARQNVSAALKAASGWKADIFVRINGHASPHWQEDIDATVCRNFGGFFLPKCESSEEVADVADRIKAAEEEAGVDSGSILLVAMIESAHGLVEVPRILKATDRLMGLALGGEDFCLDMGISRTTDGLELLYARSHLVVWARAQGCLAIDTVYSDFRDTSGLIRDAETAKQLGFSGKLAIHPAQLEIIRATFSPSEQELTEARKVVEAFTTGQQKGNAVVVLDGKMIDGPVFERAQRLLASVHQRR